MLIRDFADPTVVDRLRGVAKRFAGEVVRRAWAGAVEVGSIGPNTRIGRRFGKFGAGSVICFPVSTIFNEHSIWIGSDTMIGPDCSLSAGMVPGQQMVSDPVVRVGDRCLLGRGSGIVGHLRIDIGDDVWTGHYVYITDQNHGYERVDLPISQQSQPERPVRIGDGSWLGHGTVVLPGSNIGRHVVVAAGSVVAGDLPDFTVCAGSPAVVIRRYDPADGWVRQATS